MSKDNIHFDEQLERFLGIKLNVFGKTPTINEDFVEIDNDVEQVNQGCQVNQDYNTQLTLKNIWESRSMSNKDKARAINILYSLGIE